MITQINELSRHSNLQELLLAGNQIWRVGRGLEPCSKLKKLDLSSNRISSCHGLQGMVAIMLTHVCL
jgi:Leucine-rich repeat (LRR) protein